MHFSFCGRLRFCCLKERSLLHYYRYRKVSEFLFAFLMHIYSPFLLWCVHLMGICDKPQPLLKAEVLLNSWVLEIYSCCPWL